MQLLAQVVTRRREIAGLGEIAELELMSALVNLALQRRVGLLQLHRHAVELLAERLQLVSARNIDAMIERAGTNPSSTRLHGPNWRDHPSRQHEARYDRQHESRQQHQSGGEKRGVNRRIGFCE